MNAQAEAYEDEYEEFDEFDDEEERGLSGLVVLLMGVVMLGAFVSIVWIAYQQGMKVGNNREIPTVVADPDPVKIENTDVAAAAEATERAVYGEIEGAPVDDDIEIVAEASEEPVNRNVDDPIAAIVADNNANAPVEDDAYADRIASLAEADAALEEEPAAPATTSVTREPERTAQATPPTPARAEPAATETVSPATASNAAGALTGSHLVQVGAFRSQEEADGMWARMETRLGGYLDGKSPDTERADLGDKGVYYRLRIGPFASSDAAKTYCEGLKSRGQDCLVKAK